MWIRYNMRALWRLLVGLSAFCSAVISSSGEEFFTDYCQRLQNYHLSSSSLCWPFRGMPEPGVGFNVQYVICAPQPTGNNLYNWRVVFPFVVKSGSSVLPTQDLGSPYFSLFSTYPSEGRFAPGIPACDPQENTCTTVNNLMNDDAGALWFPIDPQFSRGTITPYYSASYSASCLMSRIYLCADEIFQHSKSQLILRGYVLPQRVSVTNGYEMPLWDMYGDGRMFFPRFIYEGGYFSDMNVTPFDSELWEQLHYYNTHYQNIEESNWGMTGFQDSHALWPFADSSVSFDKPIPWANTVSVSTNFSTEQWSIGYRLKNQRFFTTNLVDPSSFPYFADLIGYPALKTNDISDRRWRQWRYIPQSVQKGDFGHYVFTPNTTPSRQGPGYTGIIVFPISSENGAYAAFRYFRFLPATHQTTPGYFGILMLWRPSGLAYDKGGGLCFDWVSAGKPLQTIFHWPYLSSWDFDYWVALRDNGAYGNAHNSRPGPENLVKGPGTIPLPDNPPVDGVPPEPPKRPVGGGGGSSSPFPIPWLGGSTPVLGGGSGSSLLGQGPDSWVLNDGGNPITYSPDTPASLPTDDMGDLQGEYNITYPGLSDIYDFSYFANQNLWATEYEDNLIASAIFVTNPVTDFGLAGSPPPVGSFGNAVASADGSGSLQSFGHWDTSKSWFYSVVPLNPVIPKSQVLVLPWFVNEDGEIDFDSTKEFSLEGLDGSRNLILLIVGIGMSCYFVLAIIRLFQGGN